MKAVVGVGLGGAGAFDLAVSQTWRSVQSVQRLSFGLQSDTLENAILHKAIKSLHATTSRLFMAACLNAETVLLLKAYLSLRWLRWWEVSPVSQTISWRLTSAAPLRLTASWMIFKDLCSTLLPKPCAPGFTDLPASPQEYHY